METPVYDVCGKPATLVVRDAIEQETKDGWFRCRPGPLKCGCSEHPVKSLMHLMADAQQIQVGR